MGESGRRRFWRSTLPTLDRLALWFSPVFLRRATGEAIGVSGGDAVPMLKLAAGLRADLGGSLRPMFGLAADS